MANVALYYRKGCPFCQKVRVYLHDNNITVPLKEINEDPAARQELVAIGGKSQVPCLIVDGVALYESDAIIEWFRDNWGK